ncbi:MAG TPA: ABC transporter permease subunit [Bacteroidia bacterium]|nr:ABC transporter permease subunit [Bacteroidia bacterium]
MISLKRYTIFSAVSILFTYLILIISVFYFFEINEFKKVLSDNRVFYAIWISVLSASIATFLVIFIAVPSAYALSRYTFKLKPFVDVILELPMIVSPAALGAMLLIFFTTPAGLFIRENIIDVVYTFWGIVLAQFFSVLGICTRLMKAVFDEIPSRYENIARTLGANAIQTFFKVSLPLSKKGLLSSIILTWAKAIGEFGATITIAGTMAMKTETLPTAIYMKLSSADIKGTVILILILFTISISLLVITRVLLQTKNND